MSIVTEYVNNYSKYVSHTINVIKDKDIDGIIRVSPRINTVLKSSTLNQFMDNTIMSLIYLYAIIDTKWNNINAKSKSEIDRLDKIKTKIETTNDIIETQITSYHKKITPLFVNYHNTEFTTEYKLSADSNIRLHSNEISSVTITILPDNKDKEIYPEDSNDIPKILFDDDYWSSCVLINQYLSFPSSFILNGNIYNGTLVKINILLDEPQLSFNRIYMDMIPGNFKLMGISMYDDETEETIYMDINETFTSVIDYELENSVTTKELNLYIAIPFPDVGISSNNITTNVIEGLIDQLDYMNDPDKLTTIISERIGKTDEYKYKYTMQIRHIKIENVSYNNYGYIKSGPDILSSYGKIAMKLNVDQTTDSNTCNIFILNADEEKYLIIPSTINNVSISTYDIFSTDFNSYKCLNGNISLNEEDGTYRLTRTNDYINIGDIVAYTTEKYSALLPYINLNCTPISIEYIKYGSVIFTKVNDIVKLKEESPYYYIQGNLIILNKMYESGYFEIKYKRQPRWIKTEVHMFTKDNNTTPILSAINFEVIPLPTNVSTMTTRSFIDRRSEIM